MPCIFCIAVFMLVGGAIAGAIADHVEARLAKRAKGPVRRVSDSASVAKLEADIEFAGKTVPVALTVFKDHNRVRIQVLTHDLTREQIENLENELATLLEASIVERSDDESERPIREAMEGAPLQESEKEKETTRQRQSAPPTPRPN